MGKLFSDNLLQYSYSGKKGKKKFSNLIICSVIFDKYNCYNTILIKTFLFLFNYLFFKL